MGYGANRAALAAEVGTTWALVVGINRYERADLLPELSGAVADAAAAVDWLHRLGIIPSHILLHASPADDPSIAALGAQPATEDAIWKSVDRLSEVTDGTRLFVFLSGHATFEPTYKRLFLTQDFGVARHWANLSISKYQDMFLSMSFKYQFLFMDGCHNYPYDPGVRTILDPGFRGGRDITPNPDNSMIACFSCSQSEKALEIGDRGIFTRHLLNGLDPTTPELDALNLDWSSGFITMNITKLIGLISPRVHQEAAAAKKGQLQTPDSVPAGRPSPERAAIYPFPQLDPVELQVAIDPSRDAAAALKVLFLDAAEKPYWRLPHEPSLETAFQPIQARVPEGLTTKITCVTNLGWRSRPREVDLGAASVRPPVVFKVTRDRGPRTRTGGTDPGFIIPPGAEVRKLTMMRNGRSVPAAAPHYGMLLGDFTGSWHEARVIGRGVRMLPHETGPEFHIEPSARKRGEALVDNWRLQLNEATPEDVTIELHVERGEPAPRLVEIVLVPEPGGAQRIAGVLGRTARIVIGPASGDGEATDTKSVPFPAARSSVRVPPGQLKISLSLPWGSWSRDLSARAGTRHTVKLPVTVGVAPLRVALLKELGGPPRVLGVRGRPRSGVMRTGLIGGPFPLTQTKANSAAWALALSPGSWRLRRGTIVCLRDGRRTICFPVIGGRSYGVDIGQSGVRVEPLSSVASPEWDLLVANGRLDVLRDSDRVSLARMKWEDRLLGLGAAYAAYFADDSAYLSVVLQNLRRLWDGVDLVDLSLLAMAEHVKGGGTLTGRDRDELERFGRAGHIPLFRWGVRLGLDLVSGLSPDSALNRWANGMKWVEANLSLLSVWTVWSEPSTRRGEVESEERQARYSEPHL